MELASILITTATEFLNLLAFVEIITKARDAIGLLVIPVIVWANTPAPVLSMLVILKDMSATVRTTAGGEVITVTSTTLVWMQTLDSTVVRITAFAIPLVLLKTLNLNVLATPIITATTVQFTLKPATLTNVARSVHVTFIPATPMSPIVYAIQRIQESIVVLK
jgi:hypothetical protein